MRIIPYERLTLRTDSSADVVEAKLLSLVAPLSCPPTAWPDGFRGSVEGRHFKIRRVLGTILGLPTGNSWRPVIVGDIVPVAGGTEVRVRMRLQAFVGAFTAFWFGGLLWGGAMALRMGVFEGFGPSCGASGPGVGLAVVGAIMLAGYGLVGVSFWTEVAKARRALSEGLGCREVEPVKLMRR